MSLESADWSTLGKRIRYARDMQQKRTGQRMSRAALGRRIERDPRTIERWENDKNQPSHVQLQKLARLLGCRLEWLQTGEEPVWQDEDGSRVEEPRAAYTGPRPVFPQTQTVPLLKVRSGQDELVSVELTIRVHRPPQNYDIDPPKDAA